MLIQRICLRYEDGTGGAYRMVLPKDVELTNGGAFVADGLMVRAETTADVRPLVCSTLVVENPNIEAGMERVLR